MTIHLRPTKIEVTYDAASDVAYLCIRKAKVIQTIELNAGVVIDLDAHGHLLGVEILSPASDAAKIRQILIRLARDYAIAELADLRPEFLPKLQGRD